MNFGEELCQFIQDCPTPFQFTQVASKILLDSGYTQLQENAQWTDIPKKGFVIHNKRALIAFNIGSYESGIIVGTHCDSPVLRLEGKINTTQNNYRVAICSEYGSANLPRWVDRPLRLAGQVTLTNKKKVPFDSKDPIATIVSPFLCNENELLYDEYEYEELYYPIFGLSNSTTLSKYISQKLNINENEIYDHELSFVDAYPPKIIGPSSDLLSSQRIDNLTSTFSALKAFISSNPNSTLNVLAVFDYEEVGSDGSSGARGKFFPKIMKKFFNSLQEYDRFISKSLFVSSDNAQGVHPNYSKLYAEMNSPLVGKGVSIKKSPTSSYATDITSLYPLKKAAEKAGIPIQVMINRNDIRAGSTIGPIISTKIGISTVDIGQPQLAMHSVREVVAVKDVEDNMKLLTEIYNHYDDYRLNK